MITFTESVPFGENAISWSSGATLFIGSCGASPVGAATESSAMDTRGLPVDVSAATVGVSDGAAETVTATRNAAANIVHTVSTASALLPWAFGILISPP